MAPPVKVVGQDAAFGLAERHAATLGGVGQHLGDDGPSSLGVGGELDLDERRTPTGLDGEPIGVAAAKPHLAAEHDQIRLPGQGSSCGALGTN